MAEEFSFDEIEKGGSKQYDLHVAKLPTGTVINIHVFVYKGKEEGPTLLLTGGMHGDEINGTEIIRRMMRKKLLQPDAGTVVAIPVLNVYGFLNFARDVPDGKDVNRSFPGTKNGSLASRVAYNITKTVLPLIDFGIDFHTGGSTRSNYPQVRCDFSDEDNIKLAEAFAAPFILHTLGIEHSLRNEARNLGKRIIVFEGGQALRFDEFAIGEGINGTLRVMDMLGMRKADKEIKEKAWPQHLLRKTTWVRAENAGIFNAAIQMGVAINHGDLIGIITDPYNDYEVEITSPANGFVIGLNFSPVVNAGDALARIASRGEYAAKAGKADEDEA